MIRLITFTDAAKDIAISRRWLAESLMLLICFAIYADAIFATCRHYAMPLYGLYWADTRHLRRLRSSPLMRCATTAVCRAATLFIICRHAAATLADAPPLTLRYCFIFVDYATRHHAAHAMLFRHAATPFVCCYYGAIIIWRSYRFHASAARRYCRWPR